MRACHIIHSFVYCVCVSVCVGVCGWVNECLWVSVGVGERACVCVFECECECEWLCGLCACGCGCVSTCMHGCVPHHACATTSSRRWCGVNVCVHHHHQFSTINFQHHSVCVCVSGACVCATSSHACMQVCIACVQVDACEGARVSVCVCV